jgi:hypothetical protein
MVTMLSILKKPSEKAAASIMPAWHPNFRNPERLPDVKVVRTAFFINGAAVVVAIVLGLYLVQSEIGFRALRDQTADWQRQINNEKAGSEKAVAQFQKFQEEEKQLLELKDFQSSKLVGSDFILQLGESLPPRITLTMVDYHGGSIVLRGTIAGSPDEASGDASAYLDVLSKHPAFAGKFDGVSLTGISRNPTTSGISFEILLKLRSDQKGGKK